MFLFDVCEEGRVGEIPLAAWATEFTLCFFLGFSLFDGLCGVPAALLLAHFITNQFGEVAHCQYINITIHIYSPQIHTEFATTISGILSIDGRMTVACWLDSIYCNKMSREDINKQFKNYEEVKEYASTTNKTLLILEENILDVTSFAVHHPGGALLLQNNSLKDVKEQMKFHHPLTLVMANSMIIGSFKKEISRIIDPDTPLLPQIWNLNHEDYLTVINSPHWLFVPSPRMFETDFFEAFSHNKWYAVPVMPSIFVFYLFLFVVPQSVI